MCGGAGYAEEDQDVEAVRSEKSSKLVVTAAKSILDSPVFSVQSVRRPNMRRLALSIGGAW